MAEGTITPVALGAALATATDLATYGYSAVDASGFLLRASVRVRRYVRQDIAAGTDTTSLRAPFLLPQRPVVAITSVTWLDDIGVDSEDATTHTLTANEDYRLEGQYLICPAYKNKQLTVTYTFGHTIIPAELVELVCAVASRMSKTPAGLAAGFQSEGASGESISYGGSAYEGLADLTPQEKDVLDRLYPHTRKVPRRAQTL